jgi:pimeloyl-ACP methyl ester carboxylesterase
MTLPRIGKWLLLLVAALLVVFLAWFVPAKLGWFATDRQAMIARYAQPPSEFMTVDGVPMHVRVEGQGFPVLMLHGSLVNFHEWDPLVARLVGQYKIIRIDWPPYGLSGPDPRGYTTPEAARLVGLVLDKLNVGRVAVISTSNGANVALQLNADRPDRIAAMAFSILPLERPSQTRKVDWRIKAMMSFHEPFLPYYHSMAYYRQVFHDTSHPGWQVPDYLPQMMYDMGNLPNAIRNQKQYLAANVTLFKTTDVGASAGKITAPVLLQWCERDTVISQGPEASVARFTHTHVELIRYPNVGHWPMWEIPDQFANDIRSFLERVLPTSASAAPSSPAAG